jgi:hypothetical protein
MKTRIIGIALLALAAGLGSACGGDDSSGNNTTPKAGSGGAGGSGDGSVPCGKNICKPDAALNAAACCMDQFKGTCGIKSGDSCRALPASMDDRCPVPDIMGGMMLPGAGGSGASFVIVGCCTSSNECGVDYGMGGCQPRSAACSILPKSLVSQIMPITCDGTPIDLPANCGTDFMIPGAGGAGGSK